MPGYNISHSPWWANSVPTGLSYFPTLSFPLSLTYNTLQGCWRKSCPSYTLSCVTPIHFLNLKFVPLVNRLNHVHISVIWVPLTPPLPRAAPLCWTQFVFHSLYHMFCDQNLRSSVPSSGRFLCVHPPLLGETWPPWQKSIYYCILLWKKSIYF